LSYFASVGIFYASGMQDADMTKSLCTCTCNSNDWFKSENKVNRSKQATEIGSLALSVTALKNDVVTFLTETIICVILFLKFCVEEYGCKIRDKVKSVGRF